MCVLLSFCTRTPHMTSSSSDCPIVYIHACLYVSMCKMFQFLFQCNGSTVTYVCVYACASVRASVCACSPVCDYHAYVVHRLPGETVCRAAQPSSGVFPSLSHVGTSANSLAVYPPTSQTSPNQVPSGESPLVLCTLPYTSASSS